jgi:hypothetical protein
MLGVDLVGSRQIQPAHVGCAIGPDGSRRIQTVLSSLAAIQAWVQEENQQNLAMDRAYLAGQGAFPQRAAPNQLGGRFLTDFYAMVAHWADWATTIVQDWPDDPRQAVLDQTTQMESVRIAERIATTNPTPINEHWYSNRRS